MRDARARLIATIALGAGLVALVLAAYATYLGTQYLEDVRTLGESMQRMMRDERGHNTLPMRGPPPTLDPGD